MSWLLNWLRDQLESDEVFAQRLMLEFTERFPGKCVICVLDRELIARGICPGNHRCEERIRSLRPSKQD